MPSSLLPGSADKPSLLKRAASMLHKNEKKKPPLLKRAAAMLHKSEGSKKPKETLIGSVWACRKPFFKHTHSSKDEVSP